MLCAYIFAFENHQRYKRCCMTCTFQLPNENLNFDEQILEAAKCIAEATGALVKAASSAQRELVAQGRVGAYSSDFDEDSQWSQGLISAVSIPKPNK